MSKLLILIVSLFFISANLVAEEKAEKPEKAEEKKNEGKEEKKEKKVTAAPTPNPESQGEQPRITMPSAAELAALAAKEKAKGGNTKAVGGEGQEKKEIKQEVAADKKEEIDIHTKKFSQYDLDKSIQTALEKERKYYNVDKIENVVSGFVKRENELQEREKTIKLKEEQIAHAEKDLEEKIKKLNEEKEKLVGCVSKNDQALQQRTQHLVSIISTMKPDKASDILSVQDPEIAIKILSQLDPAKASKIFNLMDKEISAKIQKSYLYMTKNN